MDDRPEVRTYAAGTMAKMEAVPPKALKALADAVHDPEVEVRQGALEALGKFGSGNRDTVLPALLDALDDKEGVVRHQASALLGKFGLLAKEDFRVLCEALKRKNPEARTLAAEALAKGELTPEVLSLFVGALSDPEARVRQHAAVACGKAGPEAGAAVAALAAALGDTNKQVRRSAAESLGNIGPAAKPAVSELAKASSDADKEFRRQAVTALGKIGRADGSFEALLASLGDSDDDVRSSAIASLRAFGPLDKAEVPALGPALRSSWREVRAFAVTALAKAGAEAVPLLLEALADKELAIRKSAVDALGELRAAKAVPALTEAFPKETDSQLRQSIARAFGKMGPEAKDAVPALSKVLTEKDSALRREAALALGAIGPDAKAAATKLVVALADRTTLESVVESLAKLGKPAVLPLRVALGDKNPDVRLGATVALGKIGPDAKEAVEDLKIRQQIERIPEIREATRTAIKLIKTGD
jgi:HEAT repeat protein